MEDLTMLTTTQRQVSAAPTQQSVHPLIARAQAGDFSGIIQQELAHIRAMRQDEEDYPKGLRPFRLAGETLYWGDVLDVDPCPMCEGSGERGGKTCPQCLGSGEIAVALATSHMETPLDVVDLDEPIGF